MDIAAIRTALRTPWPTADEAKSSVRAALEEFETAVRRHAMAEGEASLSRRPSTMKATLKAGTAVDRARAHLLAELRLLEELSRQPAPCSAPAAPVQLRLCT